MLSPVARIGLFAAAIFFSILAGISAKGVRDDISGSAKFTAGILSGILFSASAATCAVCCLLLLL